MRKSAAVMGLFTVLATTAMAQMPPGGGQGMRVQGTVESVTDSALTVKTADGQTVTYALPADAAIRRVSNKTVADLKPGDYVGSTSVPGDGGKRRATEVHIIAERGAGEGHRPMDGERTMTNGNLDAATNASGNKELTISYKGGAQVIDVAPNTPVTSMDTAGRGDLKPGTAVTVMAGKDAGGNAVATRVMIGSGR